MRVVARSAGRWILAAAVVCGVPATILAGSFTVTTTSPFGAGSLGQAIDDLNSSMTAGTISFNIPSCATTCTITLTGLLANLSYPAVIDGYTQPGSSPNTLSVGDNAVLKIVIDNNNQNARIFDFQPGAAGSIVRGLVLNNVHSGSGFGITIHADNCVVEGNFIGTNAAGTAIVGQGAGAYGVSVGSGSNTRIGGTAPAQRNLISGSGTGIGVGTGAGESGTVIQGNYIGTNAAGTASLPNVAGIAIGIVSPANIGTVLVGGTTAGAGNLISGNTGEGIRIHAFGPAPTTIGALTIQGNMMGLNAAGTAALSNGGAGVSVGQDSGTTLGPVLVGGSTAAARNVISGNGFGGFDSGVNVQGATQCSVQGNFIGTDAAGTGKVGNFAWGVNVNGNGFFAGNVAVGGAGAGQGNVVSGNGFGGIVVFSSTASVLGNRIGTAADGTSPLANTGDGVQVDSSTATISGNVIAYNGHNGVTVKIGGSSAHNAANTAIRGNSIFNNGQLGIDLGDDGVTANDAGDPDIGPNNLQNFPVVTGASISGASVQISGTLNSTPGTLFHLDFFASAGCDSSGHGEGQAYLGTADVTTDGSGNVSFGPLSFSIPGGLLVVTATATDPAGNTSEFSSCQTASGSGVSFSTVSPCRIADTRNATGPYGGPALAAGADRTFVIAGQCGIPSGATAVSFNFTITQPTSPGDLRVFPGGAPLPLVSTLNWSPGQTRANNAIIALGSSGDITVHVDQAAGTVQLIIDTNGYFQ
jgi:hypothetical protein